MHPGINNPVSFNFYNHFSTSYEECLFHLALFSLSASYYKCSHCFLNCQLWLRFAFKISRLAVFGSSSPLLDSDLGSEDLLTLPVVVNDSLSASLLMDSSASSQSIDIQYAEHMNLEMTLKPEA